MSSILPYFTSPFDQVCSVTFLILPILLPFQFSRGEDIDIPTSDL